ncbi:hypothetical protein AGMMS49546_13340 [Spirochaetia bacterium]|nr:hypothetical protein AGMMS49546_13340 [Spirochaetia bacterium]
MKGEIRILMVLVARKIRELCLGIPFLIILFIQHLAFFLMQRNAFIVLERDGMLVAFHPTQYGLFISVLFLGVFILLYAAAEPARDRESGALETFFYGPLSEGIYLFASLIALIAAVFLSGINILGALCVGAIFIGYEIPASLLPLLSVTLICFCGIGTAGLFASVLFRQTRLGMIAVVMLLIFSIAVSTGNFWFSRNDISGSFALIFFRQALSLTNRVMGFIFPLGLYFNDLSWFIEYGHIPWYHILWYPVYGIFLFWAAVRVMKKRGVMVR